MPSLDDLRSGILAYEQTQRREDFGPFADGALYDLFPHEAPGARVPAASWPATWPHSDAPGVYAVLNWQLSVLYVGKASFRNSLGGRLGAYFGYVGGADRTCRIVHAWSAAPRYVYLVPVLRERSFEASALEEFLILRLQPPDNRVGCGPSTAR